MNTSDRRVFDLFAAFLVVPILAFAQNDDLVKTRQAFATELAKAARTNRDQLARLSGIYSESLAKLGRKAQADGDLDTLVTLQAETKRFAEKGSVTESDLSNDSAELRKLQQSFIASRERSALAGAKAIVAVADKYATALEALQEKRTRDGDIKTALTVKKERSRLVEHPDVSAAKFALADAEWRQRPKGPPPSTPTPPKPPPSAITPAEHEGAIRKRHRTFYQALAMRNTGTAIRFVHPEHVRMKRPSVLTRLKQVMELVRTLKKVGLMQHLTEPPEVTLKGNKEAIVPTPFVQSSRYGPRRNPPARWVYVEGDWYIDVFTY